MISARRRSRQLAMNRISVAKNSRNSAKVGDRNSSVGCTHSAFGSGRLGSPSEPPTIVCNSFHSASGRSKTCIFSFNCAPNSGRRELHSIAGTAISATTKATTVVTAITISTAPRARGTCRRSRKLAAGDNMVPATTAITTGRKNALAT